MLLVALRQSSPVLFQEGLDWLSAHPSVDASLGFGMIGCSFGALISLMASTVDVRIRAVAAVNGFHLLDSLTPLKWKGKVGLIVCLTEFVDDGLYVSLTVLRLLGSIAQIIRATRAALDIIFECFD